MHSKHDNMHKNGMLYALICINNHVIICYQGDEVTWTLISIALDCKVLMRWTIVRSASPQ